MCGKFHTPLWMVQVWVAFKVSDMNSLEDSWQLIIIRPIIPFYTWILVIECYYCFVTRINRIQDAIPKSNNIALLRRRTFLNCKLVLQWNNFPKKQKQICSLTTRIARRGTMKESLALRNVEGFFAKQISISFCIFLPNLNLDNLTRQKLHKIFIFSCFSGIYIK